jgi:hypothetical protein
MKARLELKPHSVLPGQQVVEVTWNGRLICTVVGADGPGVRIISKYKPDTGSTVFEAPRPGVPGAVEIRFELPPVG